MGRNRAPWLGAIPFTQKAGSRMAGRGAPTFLKRQKEQQRIARAQAKRDAKQARRKIRAEAKEALEEEASPEPTDQVSGPESSEDP